MGFPDSSVGKESACNTGDPGSILGLGRSAGEGISYPLYHSLASLVAQLLQNPPSMWDAWASSLGWEDPLELGKAIHSSINQRTYGNLFLTNQARIYNGAKTASSINGAGKTGQLHIKE